MQAERSHSEYQLAPLSDGRWGRAPALCPIGPWTETATAPKGAISTMRAVRTGRWDGADSDRIRPSRCKSERRAGPPGYCEPRR